MSEIKHTPGPWHIAEHDESMFIVRGGPNSYQIADVCGTSGSDIEANARLIAAGPELLEACKLLLAEWDAWQPNITGTAKERAKKAIAKAEGKP